MRSISCLVPAVLAGVLLAGCASPEQMQALQARQDEIRRTIPTCATERECNLMWDAAQLWVVKNAGYKIQTANNVLIQTFNATGSRTEIAAQVTKEPIGGGRYQIIAKVWCDNILLCTPPLLNALEDFNRTVAAAASQ